MKIPMHDPRKIVVLIDMDGTLVDFNKGFMDKWNNLWAKAVRESREANSSYPFSGYMPELHSHPKKPVTEEEAKSFFLSDPPTKFHLHEAWPNKVTEKDAKAIMSNEGFFQNLRPLPGAKIALDMMESSAIIEPYICTAPVIDSKHCWQEKIENIRLHFGPQWVERTIITKDKTLVNGDFLIDDKPHISGINAGRTSWRHVIFDQLYNRDPSEWRPSLHIQDQLARLNAPAERKESVETYEFKPLRVTWNNWVDVISLFSEPNRAIDWAQIVKVPNSAGIAQR